MKAVMIMGLVFTLSLFVSHRAAPAEGDLTLFKQFKYGMSESAVNEITPLIKCGDDISEGYICTKSRTKFFDIEWNYAFLFDDNSLIDVMLYNDNGSTNTRLEIMAALQNNGYAPALMEINDQMLNIPFTINSLQDTGKKMLEDLELRALNNGASITYYYCPKDFIDKLTASEAATIADTFANAPDSMRLIIYTSDPDGSELEFSMPLIEARKSINKGLNMKEEF